jgi:O-antigen/teichoic acid export membrane protein
MDDLSEEPTAARASQAVTDVPTEAVSRAAVRGVAWIAAERVVNQMLALAVFVALGRLLDPKAFGVMAAATVVVLFLRVFVNTGFARSLVQRADLEEEHIDAAFWTSMAIGLTLALATLLLAPVLADLFGEQQLTGVIRALSIVFVFAGIESTPSALVDREMRFGVQATRRFAATVASSVIALALAFGGAGVWALVAQLLTFEATLMVLLLALTRWRPRLRFSRVHFRDIWSFGTNYLGIRVLFYLSQNADNFLVGWILGPLALGFYVIAYRVLFVFTELVTMAVNQVALPMFSRYQNDRARLHDSFYSAVALGATGGWPVFAGLALVADQLIPFVFGAKWERSVPVMEALAGTGAVLAVTIFASNFVVAVGQVRNEFRWSVFATAAQVAVFAATAHLGIKAVAIGLTITTFALWPLRVGLIARLTGISPVTYSRQLVGPLLATAAMALVVIGVKQLMDGQAAAAALAVEITAGVLAYAAALPLLAPSAFRRILAALRLLTGGGAAAPGL